MTLPEGFLLRDPAIAPTPTVLQAALKRRYRVLVTLLDHLVPTLNISAEWRYYRDGGGWLCKLQHRRKTTAWLSIWNSGVKLSFYFTAKSAPGVFDLPLSVDTKAAFKAVPPVGAFRPLTLTLTRLNQFDEVRTLLAYQAQFNVKPGRIAA